MKDPYGKILKVGDIVATCDYRRSGVCRGQIIEFNDKGNRAHIRTEGCIGTYQHSRVGSDIVYISDGVIDDGKSEEKEKSIIAAIPT